MPKTANNYNSGLGEVVITLTAADVAALAAFTTAEAITLDGVVVSLEEVGPQARESADMHVTGDNSPIVAKSDQVNSSHWDLTIIDDYHSGAAGEWGTDLLTAVEIFEAFFAARRDISDIAITPAGGATGDIEITLTSPIAVLSISEPKIVANKAMSETVVIRLAAPGKTKAAHA